MNASAKLAGPETTATPVLPNATASVAQVETISPAPVKMTTGSPDAPPLIQPAAGAAIPISTTPTASVTGAVLIWRLDYQPEQRIVFQMPPGGLTLLTASIPAGITKPGSLIRWAIEVDQGGAMSRDPAPEKATSTNYWGTVVPNPENASPGGLPIMEWFTEQPRNVTTTGGATCSVFFGNQLYDNVQCARKGVTSLQWPKPKLKINFHKDNGFKFPNSTLPPLDRIDISSNFREPGQNSYMRETVGYALMRAAGNPTVETAWFSLNLNNEYYGCFSMLSKVDIPYLKHNSLQPEAAVYKAVSGINGNLRWGLKQSDLQFDYSLEGALKSQYKKTPELLGSTGDGSPFSAMQGLINGINGGGPEGRSDYAFDYLDLPAVVNEMAVQTAMLTQDRCTKNYYVYQNPSSSQWQRLPYDLKSSFGTDRGFNGRPASDYCVLACAQWNSPLYCSGPEYAQDLSNISPWSAITPQFGTYSGRRLLQQQLTAPRPENATVDKDLTASPPIQGANGTFNYLIKLILDVPATRQMYLRRLRSIMDLYLNGYVEDLFTANYNEIAADLKKDNAKWNGGDPVLGFKQMIQETLPIRKSQLYNMYGPGGSPELIPSEQKNVIVNIGASGGNGPEAFLELLNPQETAVDLSGFKLDGAAQFTFAPGSVIPANGSVIVAADIAAFRKRSVTPKGNEGRFVVGPASGLLTGSVSLSNQNGVVSPSEPTGIVGPNDVSATTTSSSLVGGKRLKQVAPASNTPAMLALATGPAANLAGFPPSPPEAPPATQFAPYRMLTPQTTTCATIWEVLSANPQFSIWVALIKSNTLQGPLQDPTTTITMFAPINDAFERLAFTQPLYSCTNLACLLISNPEVGRSLIAGASVLKPIPVAALTPGSIFNTSAAISLTPIPISVAASQGPEIIIAAKGSKARVLQAGLPACGPKPGDSWLHIVDTVLLPFLPTTELTPGGAAGTAFAQTAPDVPPVATPPAAIPVTGGL